MTYRFTSRSGIVVERSAHALDENDKLDDLLGRLDHERGAYFSSGVEYPDRYSRWDFGFISPPLEVVSLGSTLSVNALNGRGEAILELLAPLLIDGEDVEVEAREAGTLRLAVRPSERPFTEEERSLQPSVFGPLKRLIEDFAGIEESFLGLFGAFGHDLIFQFDPIELRLDRSGVRKDMHLYLPDRIHVIDRRLGTAHRFDFEFSKGKVGTAGLARDPVTVAAPAAKGRARKGDIVSDQTEDEYAAKVDATREYIVAGDVFELVLSRRFSAPCDRAPSALFRQMREINPSPYEFLIQFGDEQLIGASPEMFIRVEGDRVESSPI
ncbi:MAG: chorismate-binding protein, partial [Alphaproteobacteria bacterium]